MPKIEVNKVAEVLKSQDEIAPALLRRIMEQLNLAVQPDPSDDDKPPALKKQFVILISDPERKLPSGDFVGWVLQLPESESVATTIDRVLRSAYDYNTTKKGRLLPVQTIGEAIESVPAKAFKEADLWVKTKTPVLMLRTDNEIPNTPGLFGDGERGNYTPKSSKPEPRRVPRRIAVDGVVVTAEDGAATPDEQDTNA